MWLLLWLPSFVKSMGPQRSDCRGEFKMAMVWLDLAWFVLCLYQAPTFLLCSTALCLCVLCLICCLSRCDSLSRRYCYGKN